MNHSIIYKSELVGADDRGGECSRGSKGEKCRFRAALCIIAQQEDAG